MSEAIDSDVKDGFWNSLNGTLRDIADTADQIYRGKFNGSLIGSSIGFLKKWMSGGGLLSKFFKGGIGCVGISKPIRGSSIDYCLCCTTGGEKGKNEPTQC